MWLLSTDRAELRFFVSAESVPGGYAILSHVWDATEQSFQDLCKLRDECAGTGENPRDRTLAKIRDCCRLAERHGFQWLWVDTCCIDKTSSAELSEAINSMFRWYRASAVCYVHLADVEADEEGRVEDAALEASRWFTRGWTLQELLAPDAVVFFDRHWIPFGKCKLPQDLYPFLPDVGKVLPSITRIPGRCLIYGQWLDTTAAQRLSWAARRQTTKKEDMA